MAIEAVRHNLDTHRCLHYLMRLLVVSCLLSVTTVSEARLENDPVYNVEYLEEDCQPIDDADNSEDWNLRVQNITANDTASLYGYVKVTSQMAYNNKGMNCAIKVQAPEGYRITIRIPRIEIYHDDDPECEDNYMSIIGATSSKHYCGFGTVASSIYSTAGWLIFRIKTSPWHAQHDYIGFSLYYTALKPAPCDDDGKNRTEFKCRHDDWCMPRELLCDSRDNCGDWSDERVNVCGLSKGAIIAISVVCTLIGGTTIFFVAYCVYTKQKEKRLRQRRQREVVPTLAIGYNTSSRRVATLTPAIGANGRMTEPPPPYTPACYINEGVFNGANPDSGYDTIPTEGGYDAIPEEYPGQGQGQGQGHTPDQNNIQATLQGRNMRFTTLSNIRPAMGEPPPLYQVSENMDTQQGAQAAEGDCGLPGSGVSYDPLPQKDSNI